MVVDRKLAFFLLILVLFGCMAGQAARLNRVRTDNLQPQLARLAGQAPGELVSVIVQAAGDLSQAQSAVERLGGSVTKDLRIINAFAAVMRAGDALALVSSPAVGWVSLDAPVQSSADLTSARFTTWATNLGEASENRFANVEDILSPVGIDEAYGYGSNVKGAFAGFTSEYSPGTAIVQVEVVLQVYLSVRLGESETLEITPYVGGKAGRTFNLQASLMNDRVGSENAGTVFLDITPARNWKWSDIKTLELLIDQSLLSGSHQVYYDAIGIRVTVSKGGDKTSPLGSPSGDLNQAINLDSLGNSFNQAVRASDVWNEAPNYYQGSGVTVAVIDSGTFRTSSIGKRLIGQVNFNQDEHSSNDRYGHGTFITALIAADGSDSAGKYMGVAPRVSILSLRISNDTGRSNESDVVSALQWVYNNRTAYNIRVVNLSLNSSMMQSYHNSPLSAAAEVLWFNGILVVVSAGNSGTSALYPPANDPFVITVGAADDKGTPALEDDVTASFSAYGKTELGAVKPEIVAPGVDLIAYLPDNHSLAISVDHPGNRVDKDYFRMSGTSVAAPIVSGAAALLFEAYPRLTPDQAKFRLMATANQAWPDYSPDRAGAGYLDIYAAVTSTTAQSANTGLLSSRLLWSGSDPLTWGSVAWGSVSWGSVAWGSVAWGSDYWEH